MSKLYTLESDFKFLQVLKGLAQSYEEISVLRMNSVRKSVLTAREYLENISEVFFDVKISFAQYLLQLVRKHKGHEVAKLSLLNKNGKRVHVLLSASSKLHGPILKNIFSQFMEAVKKTNDDIIIVGRVGKALYDAVENPKKYTFIDIPDRLLGVDDLAALTYHITKYEHVLVYYGIFNNVLEQSFKVSNISGDEPYELENTQREVKLFLFEPSPDKILDFFEKQVLTMLLGQTIHESELARFSSRITAMENILSNIEREASSLLGRRRGLLRTQNNKAQLEKFAGMRLWRS